MIARETIDTLTSLRFFAAAAIVWFHLHTPGVYKNPNSLFAWGVSFFFVLSGFILYFNYHDLTRDGWRDFIVARVARIWPIHAVTLLVTVVLFAYARDAIGTPSGFASFSLNALLLHSFAPIRGVVLGFNGVSWSISNELFFYLAFPSLVVCARRFGFPAVLAGVAIVVLAQLLVVRTLHGMGAEPVAGWDWGHTVIHNPFIRVFEFVVGMAACHLFLRKRSAIGVEIATAAEAVSVVAPVLAAIVFAKAGRWLLADGELILAGWVRQCGGVAVFAAIIWVFAHQAGYISALLKTRALVLLGEISFSIYMVHFIFVKLIRQEPALEFIGPHGKALLIVTLSLGTAYLCWRFIEKPARRAIVGAWKRRREPAK